MIGKARSVDALKLRGHGCQLHLEPGVMVAERPILLSLESSLSNLAKAFLANLHLLLDGGQVCPVDWRMPGDGRSVQHVTVHDDDIGQGGRPAS